MHGTFHGFRAASCIDGLARFCSTSNETKPLSDGLPAYCQSNHGWHLPMHGGVLVYRLHCQLGVEHGMVKRMIYKDRQLQILLPTWHAGSHSLATKFYISGGITSVAELKILVCD
jgi:hypothetical protein